MPTAIPSFPQELQVKLDQLYREEVYPAFASTFKVVPVITEEEKAKGKKYGPFELPETSLYFKKIKAIINAKIKDDVKILELSDSPDTQKMFVVVGKDGKLYAVFQSGCLSNWSPCVINYTDPKTSKEYTFYSVEQFFMFLKATLEKYCSDEPNAIAASGKPNAEEVNSKIAASDEPNAKEVNSKIAAEIINCPCPRALQNLGRGLKLNIDAWEEDCAKILKECIKQKYLQNPEHMKFLDFIRVNKLRVVEGQPDKKYACGVDFDPANPEHLNPENWTGQNLLMDIYTKVINEIFELTDDYCK
jgi:predicted NAD-dependent protein-ADP-ribosyltransferase YbiA (DUF1768 family)